MGEGPESKTIIDPSKTIVNDMGWCHRSGVSSSKEFITTVDGKITHHNVPDRLAQDTPSSR